MIRRRLWQRLRCLVVGPRALYPPTSTLLHSAMMATDDVTWRVPWRHRRIVPNGLLRALLDDMTIPTQAYSGTQHKESMVAEIIDGKKLAATVRAELKATIDAALYAPTPPFLHRTRPHTCPHSAEGKGAPGLAVIIVGVRKDSQTYVRLKHKVWVAWRGCATQQRLHTGCRGVWLQEPSD